MGIGVSGKGNKIRELSNSQKNVHNKEISDFQIKCLEKGKPSNTNTSAEETDACPLSYTVTSVCLQKALHF